MARPLRIQYPGAFYHIMARGQRREPIYYNTRDREEFLSRLASTKKKFDIIIHAYMLMENHYHLLLETPEGNLSKVMHNFNTSYANYFRIKYRLTGSVLQGRYKSILVEKDPYFIGLSAYIHLNPVRAGLVKRPEEYRWSSFRNYAVLDDKNDLVFVDDILAQCGGAENYKSFVLKKIAQEVKKEEVYGVNSILGDDRFKEQALARLEKGDSLDEIAVPELKRLKKITESDVRDAMLRIFNITEKELFVNRSKNLFRKLYLYELKKNTDLSLKEIGKIAGINYKAIAQLLRNFGQDFENNMNIREMVHRIEKEVLNAKM